MSAYKYWRSETEPNVYACVAEDDTYLLCSNAEDTDGFFVAFEPNGWTSVAKLPWPINPHQSAI